jgi:hypothetical protein
MNQDYWVRQDLSTKLMILAGRRVLLNESFGPDLRANLGAMAPNATAPLWEFEHYGDHGPIVFELSTVVREYRISWERALADLSELAKLRWGRKWTEQRIADHLAVTYDSVHMRLRGLKKQNGCYDRLSPAVKRLVRQ